MVDDVRTEIRPQVRRAAKGEEVEWLGRFGLAAKGISYVIVAVIALKVALGGGGKPEDRQGALHALADESFGAILLGLLAAGFAAYAIWRLAEGLFDRGNEGDGAKGLAKRVGYLARAVLYGALCAATIAILLGSGGGKSENKTTAWVLDWPLGKWIVGGVGAGFLLAGLYNAYRGVTNKFEKDLEKAAMSKGEKRWYRRIGKLGHAARAVVFSLIGIFLVKAAVEYDPKEAIGLDGALQKLAGQTAGQYLLGLTAAGLLCYGLFCFVQARYRRV
jgi:Domain of Unknown Function (DUF1206)